MTRRRTVRTDDVRGALHGDDLVRGEPAMAKVETPPPGPCTAPTDEVPGEEHRDHADPDSQQDNGDVRRCPRDFGPVPTR